MEEVKTLQTPTKPKKSRKARSLKVVKIVRLKKAALNVLEREINRLLDKSDGGKMDSADYKNLFSALEILNEYEDEDSDLSKPMDIS